MNNDRSIRAMLAEVGDLRARYQTRSGARYRASPDGTHLIREGVKLTKAERKAAKREAVRELRHARKETSGA